ncbi:uncharacterized protein ARMOST_06956 [Armillaria ostoyae]|uniref:Uncharacterized protein n=1 Tax=Armillaria ostoyae TaxID=47428 RepID=A0A284R4F0_ARMOS|nr:uncharacterized protein ARMOST_06956 [Armillaria ostoyae]
MDPALCNFGENHHTSNLRGAIQPMKVPDEKSPTIVIPIVTASIEPRPDGAWAKLKHAPCEVSSQGEQAAPREENTARSPKDKNDVAAGRTNNSMFTVRVQPVDEPPGSVRSEFVDFMH